MAPEVRLHLGCGPRHLPGRLNLDAAPDAPGADLRARAECLPFADETVHTIEAYHLLEHLGWLGAHDALAEAYRVLRPGGRLVLETPDPAASCRRFLAAETREDRAAALNWLYGHEQPPGLLHRFLFPRDALAELLTRQGFAALCWPSPRTHRYAPGLRVEAVRGDDPVHLALARLRGRIHAHDLLAGLDMVARLEFAAVVDGGVEQALRRAAGSPHDLPHDLPHDHHPPGAPLPDPFRTILADLLPALLLCPDAVALLDPALPRLGPLPPALLEARQLAAALARAGFVTRRWRHLAALAERTPRGDAADAAATAGTRLLQRLGELPRDQRRGQVEALLAAELPLPPPGGLPDLPRPAWRAFCPASVLELSRSWTGHGVRLLHRAELPAAARLFTAAAGLGVEPFYALVDLAVLAVRRGDWATAEACYARALAPELAGEAVTAAREQRRLLSLAATGHPDAAAALRREPWVPGEGAHDAADLG
ncbi:MAG: methyltransferase domain-containing protein [Myxococcota bacterium]|jgi:predicted SAM-dependent methyltransferase|nr:methyltransferase domain-containing protein [Myxococcota bacterium]